MHAPSPINSNPQCGLIIQNSKHAAATVNSVGTKKLLLYPDIRGVWIAFARSRRRLNGAESDIDPWTRIACLYVS
jgi:hypothetical protein